MIIQIYDRSGHLIFINAELVTHISSYGGEYAFLWLGSRVVETYMPIGQVLEMLGWKQRMLDDLTK